MSKLSDWLCKRRERKKSFERLKLLLAENQQENPDSAMKVKGNKLIFTDEDGTEYELKPKSSSNE